MKDFRPARRHALILALIHQMRIGARDDIAEMFIRRMGRFTRVPRKNSLSSRRASAN
ncbi:hypothetical protein [Cupriavidus sp. amp6]|uniref:hypothetical protein n=1 Tax=Cupriavidus sp. amp6 TaxID=388051 RepID=UPI001E2E2BEF|nr:hypothetical protein [Cupriavidus sp. amp6]